MNKAAYTIGCIILFIGLFWILLPHAYHDLITNEDETAHSTHLVQGAILTLTGLALLIYTTREQNHPILKIFKRKAKGKN